MNPRLYFRTVNICALNKIFRKIRKCVTCIFGTVLNLNTVPTGTLVPLIMNLYV